MSAGAISGASGAAGGIGAGAFGDISSDEFIRIMIAELSNQDPFQPQDSGALLEQLSSLRNIESQLSLQTQLESLVLQNQVSAASGMIGKFVAGLSATNSQISGVVEAVRIEDGQAILELDSGATLDMSRVTDITEAPSTPA